MRCLHAEASTEVTGGGDRHIDNGVFIRFGFDDFEVLEKLESQSKTKQRRRTLGMFIDSPYYIR